MVGHEAGDAEVPAYLEDLVERVVHGLADLLVGDHVDVVEDDHGLGEVLDGDGVQVEALVQAEPLGLDAIQGLVVGQGGEEVDGVVLEGLLVLLEVLAGEGALAGPRRPGDVEDLTLRFWVRNQLELGVVGDSQELEVLGAGARGFAIEGLLAQGDDLVAVLAVDDLRDRHALVAHVQHDGVSI